MPTENPEIPEMHLTLGGVKRRLVLDLNSLSRFQKETGRNLFKPGVWDDMGPIEIRAFLWACLLDDDRKEGDPPNLSLTEVGSLCSISTMMGMEDELRGFMQKAMGADASEDDKSPFVSPEGTEPPASPSPGPPSGASEGSTSA